MASSQIEIVSAPHVLRDHNLRIRDRERECSSKARFTFQKNIDELVRDHLNNCWGSNKQLMSLSKNDENVKGAESEIRQTQVLDKWAARQAKEMITTIEKQTHKAELLQLSSTSQSVSERASTFLRETSPCFSDSSVDQNNVGSVVPNLRASSLVQMWKEFEAEVTTPRANTNTHYKRLNSMKSNHENSSVGESPIGSDTDEREFDAEVTEWENEPTAAPVPVVEQRPASVQRQDSESSEGRRVADIVKRLTSGSQTTHSSLNSTSSCNENENVNVSMNVNENEPEQTVLRDSSMSMDHSDQGEQRDLRLKRKRFTVRGREATKDLLLQMEQERHNELKKLAEFHAVSMFQQRGRIQSMLRLRFLQRGIVVQDQKRPASRVSELDQLHKRSSIVHLRERFGTKFQKDQNAPALNENDLQVTAEVPTVTSDSRLKVDEQILQTHTEQKSEEIFIEDKLRTHTELVRSALDLANAQVLNTESANRPVSVEDKLQNHMQILDVTLDSSSVPVLNEANLKRHTEVISSTLGSSKVPVLVEKTSQVYTQFVNSTEDPLKSDTSDRLSVQSVHHKDDTMSEHSSQIVTVEYSMPSTSEPIRQTESLSVPSTADYVQETKCWFSDITSDNLDLDGPMGDNKTSLGIMEHIGAIDDWEMLTEAPDFSTHQLRESTAVSWLNKVSCAPRGWESQKQTWCDDGLENGSDNEDFHALLDRRPVTNLLASSFRERMERMLLLRLQRHPELLGDADQDEIIADQYNAIGDNHDQEYSPSLQLPLPSDLLRQWNHSQDQETSEDSGTCRSLQLPQPSSAGYPDSQNCSPFRNHPSLEMEMIYELKGHVERLQYEITELRESLKSMGAEVKLSGVPKRKICCICYSMEVDSLLYRCGHMCTCFKCAHELQWNNSTCPICRSPILDVVRAYSDQ